MRRMAILILIAGSAVVGLAFWQILRDKPAPSSANPPGSSSTIPAPVSTEPLYRRFYAASVQGAANEFSFSLEIPRTWQAEAVSAIEAIALYDPDAPGESNLEKSQLFIRHFSGNDFLTLSTVTIHDRSDVVVDGRPARRYDIEKEAGIADFPDQPSWRNDRHIVTDVRVSDARPSTFYVVAQNPALETTVYHHALETFRVADTPPATTGLVAPTPEFTSRITKKRFGTHVSPNNSPVEPERFTGYHTGVDVEFEDVPGKVPVRAIANGTVTLAKTAAGYGGVVAITHDILGAPRSVIYGHLDPSSLPPVGRTVDQGDQIGHLGEGGTDETDGERKHLHFAVRTDTSSTLLGYVQREADLAQWLDPLSLGLSD